MVLLRRVIGDALRARRQGQHRTLREVSTAANVSLGYLSEIERGQKEASSELLAAICAALGAQLSELLRDASETLAMTEELRGVLVPVGGESRVDGMDRTAVPAPAAAAPARETALAGAARGASGLRDGRDSTGLRDDSGLRDGRDSTGLRDDSGYSGFRDDSGLFDDDTDLDDDGSGLRDDTDPRDDGDLVGGGRAARGRVDGGRVDGRRVDGGRVRAARVDGERVDNGRVADPAHAIRSARPLRMPRSVEATRSVASDGEVSVTVRHDVPLRTVLRATRSQRPADRDRGREVVYS
jgi:transcriptional regulator with XRE-family HTH domain